MYTTGVYTAGKRPWGEDTTFDIALPCATQNEVEEEDAKVRLYDAPHLLIWSESAPRTFFLYHVIHQSEIRAWFNAGSGKIRR